MSSASVAQERLEALLARIYPELAAGGFTRRDGTVQFFTRVNALLSPEMTVLDFGAGRAEWFDEVSSSKRNLQLMREKVDKVIGVDIDKAVLENPTLDEAIQIAPGQTLPLADHSIDLILADRTLEHLEDPVQTASEFARLLKLGGWICGRTPNKFGYIGIFARLVPNIMHKGILSRLQPWRLAMDVFPTRYLANTQRQLHLLFPQDSWSHHSYGHYPEPLYFGVRRPSLLRFARLGQYLLPAPTLMVFIQRIG